MLIINCNHLFPKLDSKLELEKCILFILVLFQLGCANNNKNADFISLAQKSKNGDIVLKAAIDENMAPFERYEPIPDYHNLKYYGSPDFTSNINAEAYIKISEDSVCTIVNSYTDMWSSNSVYISLDKDLNIINATFHESGHLDMNRATNRITSVENVILSLSKNPFVFKNDISGRYTLLIKYSFTPNEKEASEGMQAEVWYETYEAKFKVFSKEDVEKGYFEIMKEHNRILDELMRMDMEKDTLNKS